MPDYDISSALELLEEFESGKQDPMDPLAAKVGPSAPAAPDYDISSALKLVDDVLAPAPVSGMEEQHRSELGAMIEEIDKQPGIHSQAEHMTPDGQIEASFFLGRIGQAGEQSTPDETEAISEIYRQINFQAETDFGKFAKSYEKLSGEKRDALADLLVHAGGKDASIAHALRAEWGKELDSPRIAGRGAAEQRAAMSDLFARIDEKPFYGESRSLATEMGRPGRHVPLWVKSLIYLLRRATKSV